MKTKGEGTKRGFPIGGKRVSKLKDASGCNKYDNCLTCPLPTNLCPLTLQKDRQ